MRTHIILDTLTSYKEKRLGQAFLSDVLKGFEQQVNDCLDGFNAQ